MQPAQIVATPARQPPAPLEGVDAQEQFLFAQNAISKTYRRRLIEFRDAVAASPAALADLRASLPPDALPQLDELLREVAALNQEDPVEAVPEYDELSSEEQAVLDQLQAMTLPNDLVG